MKHEWKVISFVFALCIGNFFVYGYATANTNTCTRNGVQVDCITGEPINNDGPPRSELCPERQYEPIYGYYCDHKITNIRFYAVKIQHYGGGAGFPGNAQLTAAYSMNDNTDNVGEAVTSAGEVHAVRTNVGDGNYYNHYFTDLGSLGYTSSARAINNLNTYVGSSQQVSGGEQVEGIWHSQISSSFYPLGANGNIRGVATGIARNQMYTEFVTGYSLWSASGGDNLEHGFYWQFDGSSQSKVVVGSYGQANRGHAINDSKIVVGFVYNGNGKRAYKWQNNSLVMLNDFGGNDSQALDINNNVSPIIVGYSRNYSGQKIPFSWKNNVMTSLPYLYGSWNSEAKAVTDAGDVVGSSAGRAAFWREGVVYDLNARLDNSIGGVLLTEAVDVNRRGRVLAKGTDGYYMLIPSEQY